MVRILFKTALSRKSFPDRDQDKSAASVSEKETKCKKSKLFTTLTDDQLGESDIIDYLEAKGKFFLYKRNYSH